MPRQMAGRGRSAQSIFLGPETTHPSPISFPTWGAAQQQWGGSEKGTSLLLGRGTEFSSAPPHREWGRPNVSHSPLKVDFDARGIFDTCLFWTTVGVEIRPSSTPDSRWAGHFQDRAKLGRWWLFPGGGGAGGELCPPHFLWETEGGVEVDSRWRQRTRCSSASAPEDCRRRVETPVLGS